MSDVSISDLFKQSDERKLVLPNFQRDFVWRKDKQARLLSSILVGLPIGTLLIIEGGSADFAARSLCLPQSVEPKEECSYLLDGQQRVSTLRSIFSDFFSDGENWKAVREEMYSDLRYRWYIKIRPDSTEGIDPFGWRTLRFEGLESYEPGEVLDFVHQERVWKEKSSDWFNPGYAPTDGEENVLKGTILKSHIAQKAAEADLVPLHEVYYPGKQGKALHRYVLERIALQRMADLRDQVQSGELPVTEIITEDVEPVIEQLYKELEANRNAIDQAWTQLAANWAAEVGGYVDSLLSRSISQIKLPSAEIHRAIALFEYINTNATPLDVYDLIVAKAARDTTLESLSRRLVDQLAEPIEIPDAVTVGIIEAKPSKYNLDESGAIGDKAPSKIIKDQFLNLLSINYHCEYGDVDAARVKHIKRSAQLELSTDAINRSSHSVMQAISRSATILCIRCGVIKISDVSYRVMVLPSSYVMMNDAYWNDVSSINKIEYWYWVSLFGGFYRESQN